MPLLKRVLGTDHTLKKISPHSLMAVLDLYKRRIGGLSSKAILGNRCIAAWDLTSTEQTQLSGLADKIDADTLDRGLLHSVFMLGECGLISEAEARTILMG